MKKLKATCLCLSVLFSVNLFGQSKVEKKIADATYEMVKTTQGIYQNPKLLKVVEEVGRSLEKHLSLAAPLDYYLLDVSDPNAFATAGGKVFVTRGLLAIINSKDELAGVMAHELSHVTEHHVTKKISVSILPLILELPGNIIGALSNKKVGAIINFPIDATAKLGIAAFSRSQETQADEKGITLALKAGYNPYGLSEALARLDSYIEFAAGKPMKKTLLIDHPVTPERVANINHILEKKGISKSEFLAGTNITELNGMIYGQNPDGGIIVGSKFYQPQINFYCEFPDKWSIQNSPVSVTALAPGKKSAIILSIDSTASTPTEAGTKALASLKRNSVVLSQGATRINGNEAYTAMIQNKETKYAEHVTEIMWIKISSSEVMLKVVGFSDFKNPDKSIATCFNTYRLLADSDLKDIPVMKIELREAKEWKDIETLVESSSDRERQLKSLLLLNGLKPNQNIPKGNYLKVVQPSAIAK